MACSPLEILAEIHVRNWSQPVITYSTTIKLCEEGVPMACSPLEILEEICVRNWSQAITLTVPPLTHASFWQRFMSEIGSEQSSLTVPP